ncbi:alpha/beta fold hydrolase [Georgenia sp. SYP-B2076]|uniref:alpha/beta fold hydrolase n=1 Tax=Georgenia sp. SYP-B2076 TaxID=2495881 RepID=UPI000F8EE140|nr:alpha/beta hydrolase [Georgenia sp. SYP-B2076]
MERSERPTGAHPVPDADPETQALPDVDGVTHRFVALPGLRMHVAEAGSGEPVLLLHGSPQHWWAWHGVIPHLVGHYRVICPDLRGSGWTDAPPGGYTRDQMLADVVALLDTLGLGRVRLASHDMGAITGYVLCRDHPERVERHVVMGVPPPFVKVRARLLPRFRHLWHQEVLAIPGVGAALVGRGRQRVPRHMLDDFVADPAALSPADMDIFLARLREPDRARAQSAMYRHLVLPEAVCILRGRYGGTRLRTPTMVMVGTEDQVFPPAVVRALLRGGGAHADHVELAAVKGAAHYLATEAPEQVADLMLRFFAEVA